MTFKCLDVLVLPLWSWISAQWHLHIVIFVWRSLVLPPTKHGHSGDIRSMYGYQHNGIYIHILNMLPNYQNALFNSIFLLHKTKENSC